MEAKPRRILKYRLSNGEIPFDLWLGSLKDLRGRAKVRVAVERLAEGNLGVFRRLGGGVSELKVDFGPGYRVYFGEQGRWVVILLCGGDKGSQGRDVLKAGKYWEDCRRRLDHEP